MYDEVDLNTARGVVSEPGEAAHVVMYHPAT